MENHTRDHSHPILTMHSFPILTIHESRNLKQARPTGQYVDLLRCALATPSWDTLNEFYHVTVHASSILKPLSPYAICQFSACCLMCTNFAYLPPICYNAQLLALIISGLIYEFSNATRQHITPHIAVYIPTLIRSFAFKRLLFSISFPPIIFLFTFSISARSSAAWSYDCIYCHIRLGIPGCPALPLHHPSTLLYDPRSRLFSCGEL